MKTKSVENIEIRLENWIKYAKEKFGGARLDEFVFELSLEEAVDIIATIEILRNKK